MPTPKNKLDDLLQTGVLSSGNNRQIVLTQIRAYVRGISTEQLKKEIAVIDSLPELSFLQAAGVPAGAQEVHQFTIQRLSGK